MSGTVLTKNVAGRTSHVAGYETCDLRLATIFALLLTLASACVGGGATSDKGVPFVDDPVGDEGESDPTTGDPYVAPGEECQSLDTVSISPTSIGFGLSEINDEQCQTIAVNPCVTFSAEIDDSSDSNFVLHNQEESEVSGRLTAQQEALTVCYKRTEIGSHSGRVNIIIGSGSATYAYVVPLTGSTVDSLFNIASPTEGQLIWEKDGVSSYDSASSAFKISSSGTINSDLSSIFTSTNMTITVGGQTQTIDIGSSYSFSTTLSIPDTPAVYPVDFTMQTSQGSITHTINTIRYSRPDATAQIRNSGGGIVSAVAADSATETDGDGLVLGVIVNNLDVSGPREEYPVRVRLSITRPDGSVLQYNPASSEDSKWENSSETPEEFNFYYASFPFGEEENENGTCNDSFSDPSITYCLPMPATAELGRGINTVKATLCNDYTDYEASCVTTTAVIDADNDFPIINVTQPLENSYYDTYDNQTATILLTGTIENFVSSETTKDATTGVETTTCLTKLWLNNSTLNTPIELCNYMGVVEAADESGTDGNDGNIKKATFSVPLTFAGDANGNNLTLYTNLAYIEAIDANGHTAYLTRSFQIGSLNKSTTTFNGQGTSSVTSGQLGEVSTTTGSTEHAPVMLYIDADTLNGSNDYSENIIKALEKTLNDNFNLADIIQGYTPDDNGEIPADLEPNSHMTGVPRVMKWLEDGRSDSTPTVIENFNPSETENAGGYSTPGTCAAVLFIKNLDDERLFGEEADQYSFWSPAVFGKRNASGDLLDRNGNVIDTKSNGYPRSDADLDDIAPNYDFNDIEQGKFTVDKLEMNDGGKITAHITLHGFKGHAVAFTTCEYGAMSFPPAIPIYFNIGELKLRLNDIQLKKIQLKDDGTEYFTGENDSHGNPIPENRDCSSGHCTNKLIIDEDKIVVDDGSADSQSVYITASHDCADTEVGSLGSSSAYYEPFGCNLHEDFVDAGFDEYYWMTLETRNDLDYLTMNPGPSLLVLFQEVLRVTFKDTLYLDVPKLMVNPLFDPVAFPYPSWMPDNQKVDSLKMALDNTDDGLGVASYDDAENPAFSFDLNLKESDLLINEDGIILKLPFSLGADGISNSSISSRLFNRISPTMRLTSGSSFTTDTTRNNGYMRRNPSDSESLEGLSNIMEDVDVPFVGISMGLEELGNSAFHIILKKNLKDLIELIDKDLVEDLNMQDGDLIGLDKVILGNFDICNQVDILSTDLPPSFLISEISQYAQGSALHLDIALDKNSPPTLALLPIPGDESAKLLQIGLSNVQIDFKDLLKEDDGTYTIGDSIVKMRLDMTLKITMKYSADTRRLELYIAPLEETPLYISVINSGMAYDQNLIINSIRNTVLPPLWSNFSASYTVGGDTNSPVMAFNLPSSATGFGDTETVTSSDAKDELTDAGFAGMIVENYIKSGGVGSCEDSGTEPPQYSSDSGRLTDMAAPTITILDGVGSGVVKTASRTSSALTNKDGEKDGEEAVEEDDDGSEMETVDCGGHSITTDNEVVKSLCPSGISDIGFGSGHPQFILDSDNGYIHISTELLVEIYDWLNDDVEVE